MDDRGLWKVGLIAILAVAGIIGMVAFLVPPIHARLTGGRWNFYIVFDDVGGLQPSEKVTLAGVTVGNVGSVELVTRPESKGASMVQGYLSQRHLPQHPLPFALVKVEIEKPYQGQLYNYYNYEVGSSSLIGTTHEVTISPAPPPPGGATEDYTIKENDVVVGATAAGLSNLAKPAGAALNSVADLSKTMQQLVGDPKLKQDILGSVHQVHQAAENLNGLTEQAKGLASNVNNTLLPRVTGTVNNLQASSANIRSASAQVPGMMNQMQGSLTQVRGNLVSASERAPLMMAQVQGSLTQARGNLVTASANIRDTTGNIKSFVGNNGTLSDLRRTTANVADLTGNLKEITSNQDLKQDLPDILNNVKKASADLPDTVSQAKATLSTFQTVGQNANTLLGGIKSILPGKGGGSTTTGVRQPPPAHQPIGIEKGIGFMYSESASGRFPHRGIVDPEVRFLTGPTAYYLGLFDIGGQNRITAEIGHRLVGTHDRGMTFRYGLYRGFAGMGSDVIVGPKLGFYATAYDANRPTFDIESVIDLASNYGIWAGVDEVNRQPRVVLGIRVAPK